MFRIYVGSSARRTTRPEEVAEAPFLNLLEPWCTIGNDMENVMFAKYASLDIGFAAIFVANGWACIVTPDK